MDGLRELKKEALRMADAASHLPCGQRCALPTNAATTATMTHFAEDSGHDGEPPGLSGR